MPNNRVSSCYSYMLKYTAMKKHFFEPNYLMILGNDHDKKVSV